MQKLIFNYLNFKAMNEKVYQIVTDRIIKTIEENGKLPWVNFMIFVFTTSERDNQTITKDEKGQYYERRYGLPILPITIEEVKQIA
jgi:hypothetical protein